MSDLQMNVALSLECVAVLVSYLCDQQTVEQEYLIKFTDIGKRIVAISKK